MKGMVIGIKKSRAIVMESGGSFHEIKNNGYRLGQEIEIPQKRNTFIYTLAACIMLFVLTGIGGYSFYNIPKSYIYVDINPSLRLEMNCFDRVISAVPLNEDAVVLLEQYKPDMSSGEKCVDSLIEASLNLGYLCEKNMEVQIDLHTENEKLIDAMATSEAQFAEEGISVTVFELDSEQNKFALANEVSASRLRALESYTEFFGGTLDENMIILAETASQEIYAQIREYRRSTVGTDENAYTDQRLKDDVSTQDTTESQSSESTTKYTTRRLQAVERYTEYFGGTIEENTKLLESLTIGEIYEKIRIDRLDQQTDKKRKDSSDISQGEISQTSSEEERGGRTFSRTN